MGQITPQSQQFDNRARQLQLWLEQKLSLQSLEFEMISGDASFRRYFRLKHACGTLIAVDAPPQHENNPAFVGLARGFLKADLCVPEIFAVDVETGFMAISDLGEVQLLSQLHPDSVDKWYQRAMQQLIIIQKTQHFKEYELPQFDRQLLLQEMHFMPYWFLQKHLSLELTTAENRLLESLFERLSDLALSQPQVTTHCDYHSRNLMVTQQQQIGIIDFQDARCGAVTYDLISLIKDCYIRWPRQQVEGWMAQFYEMLKQSKLLNLPSLEEFIFLADAMALQRHIKVVGIFARLYHRDGKAHYLNDIPMTLEYIVESCERYEEFEPFGKWLKLKVLPKFKQLSKQVKDTI